MFFNAESWARAEPHIRNLPGAAVMCERVRSGVRPWPDIGGAMSYCTGFPEPEFSALLASGDFDVRWPLTFAAWFWGASSASVDKGCAAFLTAANLWDQALAVLPEYAGTE